MRQTFIVPLPVEAGQLSAAEDFTRALMAQDVAGSKGEFVRVTRGEDWTKMDCRLRKWLPQEALELLQGSGLCFSVVERRGAEEVLMSWASHEFPLASALVRRTVDSKPPAPFLRANCHRLDPIAAQPPLLAPLKTKTDEKLRRILGTPELDKWEALHRGDITYLRFDCAFVADYGPASSALQELMSRSFKNYLGYFYKSLLLFRKRWARGVSPPAPPHPQSDASPPLFIGPIESFEALKLRTNFLGVQASLTSSVDLPSVPLKEAAFLKRGEGPIDFGWNERYVVLLSDRLVYYKESESFEKGSTVSLVGATVGKVQSFDGQSRTFCLENTREKRTIWLAARTEEQLLEWRRFLLSIVLNVPISESEVVGDEGVGFESGPVRPSTTRKPPVVAINCEPGRAERLGLGSLRRLCESPSGWEFYAMRDGVKLFFPVAQRKDIFESPRLTPFLVVLAVSVLVAAAVGRTWEGLALLILAGVVAGWKATKTRKLALKGSFLVDQSLGDTFAFAATAENLEAWNLSFHRVAANNAGSFEATLRANPRGFNALRGELFSSASSGSATVELYFSQGTFVGRELLRLTEVPLKDSSLLQLDMVVETEQAWVSMAWLLRETERRLASLALLRGVGGRGRPRTADDHSGAGLFLRGRPFLDSPPDDLSAFRSALAQLRTSPPFQHSQFESNSSSSKFPDWVRCALTTRILGSGPSHVVGVSLRSLGCLLSPIVQYLHVATETADPCERAKLVCSGTFAGLAEIARDGAERILGAPPSPGRTMQVFFPEGSALDAEQLSSQSIGLFMQGAGGKFALFGRVSSRLSLGGNDLIVELQGRLSVVLPPLNSPVLLPEPLGCPRKNQVATLTLPCLRISGVFGGPVIVGAEGSLRVSLGPAEVELRVDAGQVSGQLKTPGDNSPISGRFPSWLSFGGSEFWNSQRIPSISLIPGNRVLPSDEIQNDQIPEQVNRQEILERINLLAKRQLASNRKAKQKK